jgi:hypothetical protein
MHYMFEEVRANGIRGSSQFFGNNLDEIHFYFYILF